MLYQHIQDRSFSPEKAAKALGMSSSTLNRRLREENYSFGQISTTVRMNMADRYLSETGLSIAEIAYRLGYADQSSFSTAYKRWKGQSPRVSREEQRSI
jgi:AraC-like DNA-binding protein